MGYTQAVARMTTTESIARQDTQADKRELSDAKAAARVGVHLAHVAVRANTASLLKAHLRGGPGPAHTAAIKAEVKTAQAVFSPEVLSTAYPEDLRAETVMPHPKVIAEGLFEAAAAYACSAQLTADRPRERHEKHALIDPDRRTIEVHRRMPGGDRRPAASASEPGLILKSRGLVAAPAAVFEGVDSGDA